MFMKMMQLSHVGVYVTALGLASTAFALDGSWNVDASGSWTNDANWTENKFADGAGYTATFNRTFTGNRAVTIHLDQAIGNLLFGTEGNNNLMQSNSEFLIAGSPKKLTLDNGASMPWITCWALAPVNSACRISTPIVSPLGFVKEGTGTLWLNADNPELRGTIHLRRGRIFAQTAATAFGTASVVVSNNCYISFWLGGTYTNAFELNGLGSSVEGQRKWTLTADNSTDLTLSGPIQLNASAEFGISTTNSKTFQISGPVSGPGALVAGGNGRVNMVNPKDFSGGIVVSNTCVLVFGASTNCLGMPSNKTNLITVLPGACLDLENRQIEAYYPASQGHTITVAGYGSNPIFTNAYGSIYGAIISSGGDNTSNQGAPNIRMVGDTWIGNNGTGTARFYYKGTVSGPYNLIKVGSKTLVAQGNFADDVKALIVSNGTFESIQSLGKAAVSVSERSTFTQYGPKSLANKIALYSGSTFTVVNGDVTWSGEVSLYGTSTLNQASTRTMTLSQSVIGNGGFKKIGAGKLVLSGTNTFSGSMWVTNGIVQVNSTNSLPVTADVYLYTASSNGSTPIAQLNLNYDGVRAVRRFYIDDELQTRNKIYTASNSKLTITGVTGAICPSEGTNPKGTIIRFY